MHWIQAKCIILNLVFYNTLSLTTWRTLCMGRLEQCHWAIFHAPHRQMLGQAVKGKKKKYSGTKITRRRIKPTRLFVVSSIWAQKFCTETINMKSTWWKIKFPSCVSFLCLKASVYCFFEPCPTLVSPLAPERFSLFALRLTDSGLIPERGSKSNAVMSKHNPEADS